MFLEFYVLGDRATSFPGLSYEDEARHEKALVWAGHVTTQKMAVFDSYSSRSGEIFFNEIYKFSKQISKQPKDFSIDIIYVYRAKFGTNQLKSLKIYRVISEDIPYNLCFLRYTDISEDFQPQAKLHPNCI